MILRYEVQVSNTDEAYADLRRDDQTVDVIREDEIRVSINDRDLGRLGLFIDWLRLNSYALSVEPHRANDCCNNEKIYNVMCG